MGGELGAVRFQDLELADNAIAGFEVELDVNEDCDIGYLDGAVIIGRTNDNIGKSVTAPHGIITPRSENYWIKNVCFFNFDFDGDDPLDVVVPS